MLVVGEMCVVYGWWFGVGYVMERVDLALRRSFAGQEKVWLNGMSLVTIYWNRATNRMYFLSPLSFARIG